MQLYFSYPSPYARKARVAMRECGLEDKVEEIAVNPWADPEGFRDLNPFGRVPTLLLDDGSTLFQSNVVCEYFDRLAGGGRVFPKDMDARIEALRLLAYADSIKESCVFQRMEQIFHKDSRSGTLYERQNRCIGLALDALEKEAGGWTDRSDIGLIALMCALQYRDFRFPEDDWRATRPNLAACEKEFRERPSLQATAFKD